MKWIYKITWPNKLIYIGKDETGDITYFGSPSKIDEIAKDFSPKELRDMIIRREILWESETVTNKDLDRKEKEFIKYFQSNNPEIGYNRSPKFKP